MSAFSLVPRKTIAGIQQICPRDELVLEGDIINVRNTSNMVFLPVHFSSQITTVSGNEFLLQSDIDFLILDWFQAIKNAIDRLVCICLGC
jgi:hypothetical protein